MHYVQSRKKLTIKQDDVEPVPVQQSPIDLVHKAKKHPKVFDEDELQNTVYGNNPYITPNSNKSVYLLPSDTEKEPTLSIAMGA